MKTRSKSAALRERACQVIPGGVNSPVRAFAAVGGAPIFLSRGAGARVWDADDNEYIDFLSSWGPLILGHAPKVILDALTEAAALGTSFGASTAREVIFAEQLTSMIPSMEKVRLVNSGTEATMSAIRLARGCTGRAKVVKMDGGYHGHADGLLVKAGSGAETFGVPDSAGVSPGTAADTLTVPYNDVAAAEALFNDVGSEIAAVIIEPVAGNMGVVPPQPGYLKALRDLTRRHGALLIFDEVITGLRLGLGGAQLLYGVLPDLTCLGKIIGGGLPVGAYGGKASLMDKVSPDGPVYQAGTLSGNPLAVAAGMAMVQELKRLNPYPELEALAHRFKQGLLSISAEAGVPLCVNGVGSMFTCFFQEGPVTDLTSAKASDTALFARYHRAMLDRGVFLAPSQFEAGFVGTCHTEADIDTTLGKAREVIKSL